MLVDVRAIYLKSLRKRVASRYPRILGTVSTISAWYLSLAIVDLLFLKMASHLPTQSDSGSEPEKSQIYTALPLSAPADRPSANSVRWSSDGQLIVVTKSAIHIYVELLLSHPGAEC